MNPSFEVISTTIQNTSDEGERLAALAALREFVEVNPDHTDAANLLHKYSVFKTDFTKELRTPAR